MGLLMQTIDSGDRKLLFEILHQHTVGVLDFFLRKKMLSRLLSQTCGFMLRAQLLESEK